VGGGCGGFLVFFFFFWGFGVGGFVFLGGCSGFLFLGFVFWGVLWLFFFFTLDTPFFLVFQPDLLMMLQALNHYPSPALIDDLFQSDFPLP